MTDHDAAALQRALEIATAKKEREAARLAGLADIWTVFGVDGHQITVRRVGEDFEQTITAADHVECQPGDEVLTVRAGGRWFAIAVTRRAAG